MAIPEAVKAIDSGEHGWGVDTSATTLFDFDYTDGRDQLLRLYDKGTRRQWIGSRPHRLVAARSIPNNPLGMPDEIIADLRHASGGTRCPRTSGARCAGTSASWQFSQFMHGEQGALICTAKIVQTVPDIDSKFYAATQVIDEARHVEVYSRYLHEKLQLVYPLNANLRSLLDDVISDSRWDMTYLGMQVLIEGLALAAFALIRNQADRAAGEGDQRVRDAGRGPPRDVRPARAARLLPAAHRRRSGTSARSSASTPAT